ncbi:MAG: DUF4405 domain-containing protein [Acidobacteria bacterium]|nr:DUF4405 domain-containing protein [Acidobacteriota bacterium]
MMMSLDRNYVTPLTFVLFLVLAITGILMFFHLFDGYTEVVHELMGLGFVVVATAHTILNWKALRRHFRKRVFAFTTVVVLLLSIGFVILERTNMPLDMVLMNKVVKAPLTDALRVLDVDLAQASEKLKRNGIFIEDARTLEDIWIKNGADPERILHLIME